MQSPIQNFVLNQSDSCLNVERSSKMSSLKDRRESLLVKKSLERSYDFDKIR